MKTEQIKEIAYEIFSPEKMLFNKLLGFEIDVSDIENPKIKFKMREELIGNHYFKILHGGVISSVIDTMGGLIAFIGVLKKINLENGIQNLVERLSKISTIDLRVDYLRPGKGDYFICTGKILRTGNKVAVNRMELRNNENELIAVGTGTYLVG